MNKGTVSIAAILLLAITSTALCMQKQPRTPRQLQPANTPARHATEFIAAINIQDYAQATVLLNHLPSHPIAIDCKELYSKTMTEKNIFYNTTNFDSAYLEPFNREHLKQFAKKIMYNGQLPERSEDSKIYFYRAEKRFNPHTESPIVTAKDCNVTEFIKAINGQNYNQAVTLLNLSPLHPVAQDGIALLNKTMLENNIFYSKANFDNANLESFDRKYLMRFARGIMKSSQKKGRSESTRTYYSQAEKRFLE